MSLRKIINDPVHGFITIDDPLILQLINHPWYQRLRRIHQMALAQLVYPGAVHTRLHHSLGAYHLMRYALFELQLKGITITPQEARGAKIAILLHDIGHGPFSHALEGYLATGLHHETLSIAIMHKLNAELGGALDIAIAIFTNTYNKPYLHQLVSGQLDVDRMDYLTRDSFNTGVSEGAVGYDRILKMITVHQNHLVVEEKAIFSIEKFLIARRLMYWQVYLHKTVVVAEQMLRSIILRAKAVQANCATTAMQYILHHSQGYNDELLTQFCSMDDYDVLSSIKAWMTHTDAVLAQLSTRLINRDLLKIKYVPQQDVAAMLAKYNDIAMHNYHIPANDLHHYVYSGVVRNSLYQPATEQINILYKDGTIKDIADVDNALVHTNSAYSGVEEKHYVIYIG